jgi:hypothetical protein
MIPDQIQSTPRGQTSRWAFLTLLVGSSAALGSIAIATRATPNAAFVAATLVAITAGATSLCTA